MAATPHPNLDQLRAYSLGELPLEAIDEISHHLASCPECETSIAAFDHTVDPLVASLGAPQPEQEYSQDSAFRRAMEFVRRIGGEFDVAADEPAAHSPSLGRLREYELLEKLGEGGMGAVYKARHVRLNKLVAVKVLPRDRMSSPEAVARFEREMLAVGNLDHPHLIRAHDAGEVDGIHFLVMEHVTGRDLSQIAKACGPLPVPEACELVRQAALGLQYAHENGLVHRDIKPSNLMLTPQGQVKILDLGLALLQQEQASEELTVAGQVMGTLDYMAPEQGNDSHEVSPAADLYSLGATLYRLIAGHPPFGSQEYQTPLQKLTALATQSPSPVRELRADVPTDLSAWIERLLAKNPAERPSSAAELAEFVAPYCSSADLPALYARAAAAGAGEASPSAVSQSTASCVATQHDTGRSLRTVERHNSGGGSTVAAPLPAASGRKRSIRQWAIAAAAAGALMLLGVWIIIRDKEGNEIARFKAPEGSTATLQSEAVPGTPQPVAPVQATGTRQPPTPVAVASTDPMHPVALVQHPAKLPGLKSWTIETVVARSRPLQVFWYGANEPMFSPDSRWFADFGADGAIRIYAAETGELEHVLVGHVGPVWDVAWAPDSRRLISGGDDRTVRIWDVSQGRAVRVHSESKLVESVAWSPDGSQVAYSVSLFERHPTCIRDVWTWDLVAEIPAQPYGAAELHWSPDGKHFAQSLERDLVQVYRASDFTLQHSFPVKAERRPQTLSWTPDSKVLIASHRGVTDVLYLDEPERNLRISTRSEAISCLASDGNTIVFAAAHLSTRPYHLYSAEKVITQGDTDGKPALARLDLAKRQFLDPVPLATTNLPNVVCYSPDGRRIVGRSRFNERLVLRDAATLRLIHSTRLEGGFNQVAPSWSADGRQLACAGHTATTRGFCQVWGLDPVQRRASWNNQSIREIQALRWTAEGEIQLADGSARLFSLNPRSARPGRIGRLHEEEAFSGVWFGPGDLAATWHNVALPEGKSRGMLRLLSLANLEVLHAVEGIQPVGEGRLSNAISFSPDEKWCAVITRQGPVELFEVATGQKRQTLPRQPNNWGEPIGMAWSADSRQFACLDIKGISIYEPSSGKPLQVLGPFSTRRKALLRFSDVGKQLIALGIDGPAVFDLATGKRTYHATRSLYSLEQFGNESHEAFSPDSRYAALGGEHTVRVYDMLHDRFPLTLIWTTDPAGLAISGLGHFDGDPSQLVYVALTEDDQQLTFTPEEFSQKYGWKNDPSQVRLGTEGVAVSAR